MEVLKVKNLYLWPSISTVIFFPNIKEIKIKSIADIVKQMGREYLCFISLF
jgi:hypothetical protein